MAKHPALLFSPAGWSMRGDYLVYTLLYTTSSPHLRFSRRAAVGSLCPAQHAPEGLFKACSRVQAGPALWRRPRNTFLSPSPESSRPAPVSACIPGPCHQHPTHQPAVRVSGTRCSLQAGTLTCMPAAHHALCAEAKPRAVYEGDTEGEACTPGTLAPCPSLVSRSALQATQPDSISHPPG